MTSKEEDHDFIDVKLVEELEKDGMIPLDIYTASMIGDFVTVGQLIQSGSIDFDKKNKNGGWTALMYASYVGRDNIVNMLLEAGASVNIATPKMGITALMLAADCGNESIAYFLVQQGASVNTRDKKGQTALFHAVEGGHINVVKLLLDCDADIEARQSQTLLTPLMVAAIEGHAVIFSMLLEYGADLKAKSHFGETAVTLANRFGNITIVNVIENMCQKVEKVQLRGEPGLFENDLGVRDGPEKIARLAREAREASMQKAKKTNVIRGRDMVSPIDARDYEPVDGSWIRSEFGALEKELGDMFGALEKELGDMALSEKDKSLSQSAPSADVLKGDVSQTIVIPARKTKVSRICYEAPKQPVLPSSSQDQDGVEQNSIADVLDSLKLTKYYPCFEKEDVDMDTFLTLTDEDLRQIGIDKLGPRKKLISFITKHCQSRKVDNKFVKEIDNEEKTSLSHKDDDASADKDAEGAIQQAHAYVEYLQAQLYKEKQGRHELESYFVAERGRLDQVQKSAKQMSKTLNETASLLNTLRTIGNTTAEKITFMQKEPSTDKKTLTKNAEEAASLHQQSLNIIDKITSQFSFVMRTSQFLNGICTDEGAGET